MTKSWIFRIIAIGLGALGGAAGLVATHIQNEEDLNRKIDERLEDRGIPAVEQKEES